MNANAREIVEREREGRVCETKRGFVCIRREREIDRTNAKKRRLRNEEREWKVILGLRS